jgi:glutathione S-transferase
VPITLHHHPYTRAANVVWMLEEVGCDYELVYVDLQAGAHKHAGFRAINPMGKLPTLVDGDAIVTESAAIGLYLADRYAPGRLAPTLDAPARATYLRWAFYAPSVIEPGCMAKSNKWEFGPGQAGWGTYEEMLDTISAAVGDGPWLLGEQFTMVDVIFSGTLGWLTMFGMLDKRPEYMAYVERARAREAYVRSRAINDRIVEERGLKR